jgi:protein gp37
MENTKIGWCDHTFNPWRGCTKVSPGCANCYAEALSKRNPKVLGAWGRRGPRRGGRG